MESIWTSTNAMPRFPSLRGEHHTGVLVIGGGMAGLLCALSLQKAGVDCTLVEAATIAGGITKNTTAKITSQHGLIYHKLIKRFGAEKAGLYLKASQLALEEYRRICQGLDCDFETRENFIYSTDDPQELDAELNALEVLHFPAELVQTPELPFETLGAVKFPEQAQFHPLKFLSAIANELTIFENTPVRELMKGAAITDQGKIFADHMIVATHFPFLNKHGSYFLKLYQQRSYVLSLENAPVFQGMYLDSKENGLSFRSYGDSLILGGGGHRTGKQGGSWQELETFTQHHYPGAKITHRWATQDCMSLDGVPYIGRYSARTGNLWTATGFNKWGMTNSMVAALVLRDLITGKGSEFEALYSPSRTILRPQLAVNGLESTKNLLSFSQKRCPHLGCALKWNSQEHSWDCPCHGSRFTEDGRLIDNPATGDLKKRE